ncbi:MAG TPA: hypothetical protein PLB81_05720 [Deltaproteobacteria bacterium]|nr:hypothetical protein [Deltaproteobacteria bacterium]
MDIRDKVPVIRVAIRGANGRMGLQAIYASMENNEDILRREKLNALTDKDVWIDIVFGAFTSDIPTVQQLLAGVLRSEKDKILEGYDKAGHPIYRAKGEGKFELRTKYVEQKLTEEPQREHVILFTHQEIVDTPEGLPAIKILSADRQNVLSTIRHINVRFGELSAEAIMDRVLDISHDLGANVLLSCVGDTAKQADRMKKWLDEIHEKGYSMGFIESAPAKGWEKRLLSKQDAISVLCTRNFSPTGTLFRTGLALKRPLFEYKKYEFAKASQKFQKIFLRIIKEIIATDDFKPYAKLMEKSPKTIKAVEGETVLVNFPPDFLNVTTPNYIKFSFYEDNEYGFVCGAMIPNLKALGLVYKDKDTVNKIRSKPVKYEAVTNIPGIFGTDWMVKAPAEIISRGGALSTSSCTTNGNVVGDYIMCMALDCYYEFFSPEIKGYFLTGDGEEDKRFEEIIDKRFQAFKGHLADLLRHRSKLIRKVFNFYYEDVQFMDTDMQHGLTRSESPDVLEFLRETSSGSQTEVPKILSLPEREIEYFKGLKTQLKKNHGKESDEAVKAEIQKTLDKIDDTLKTIDGGIHIVHILEQLEGK